MLDGYRCTRCGHEWLGRTAREPTMCPKCKSCYWDRERERVVAIQAAEEWQAGEREADADIQAGRLRHFDDAEAAIAWLESDDA